MWIVYLHQTTVLGGALAIFVLLFTRTTRFLLTCSQRLSWKPYISSQPTGSGPNVSWSSVVAASQDILLLPVLPLPSHARCSSVSSPCGSGSPGSHPTSSAKCHLGDVEGKRIPPRLSTSTSRRASVVVTEGFSATRDTGVRMLSG